MPLDFRATLRPTPRHSVLSHPDWCIWGGTMARGPDGKYYLIFARWPIAEGHNAWVTHSELAVAVADHPLGPYRILGPALPGAGGDAWDAEVTHNPSMIVWQGKYYLYYMGTRGPGGWWDYRNRQRIGVAVADHPAGPWERFGQPVLDVTDGAWDCLMTSNPSCAIGPDGRLVMLYKGVGQEQELPRGGPVLCGVAMADHPLGPFVKHPEPIIANPEQSWAVEDSFGWYQDGLYYALAKDYHGYFTGGAKGTTALFWSSDGITWQPQMGEEAVPLQIAWEDGAVQPVHRLERMQIWFQQGRPAVLFLACLPEKGDLCFNVHVPLAGLVEEAGP